MGRIWLLILGLISCSEDSNPMRFLVTSAGKTSHDSLLYDAEAALDQGDYEKAIAFGEKAYKLDSGSERGAVILGFAYMAKAGVDPFRLAEKLMNQGESKALAEESSNPLDPLKALLGLDEEELANISLEGNKVILSDGSVVFGAPPSGIFRDYPLLFPKTAAEARISGSEALSSLTRAIAVICPFVADEAKVFEPVPDPRHSEDVCQPADKELFFTGKSHYIWAFSHLIEAIAFNSVVLYDPTGSGANLLKRSDALAASSSGNVADYVKGVKDLAVSVDIIFPTAADKTVGSMLSAMVNDLQATSRGFDLLPGMPESMTKSIDDTLAKLAEQTAKIKAAGTANESQAASSALKNTLTTALGDKLEGQIDTLTSQGSLSKSQLSEVCQSYRSISTEALKACE